MSLRIFHLVFVGLSVVMCLVVGGWATERHVASAGASGLALAVACFVLGAVLIVYGFRVYRKLWALDR